MTGSFCANDASVELAFTQSRRSGPGRLDLLPRNSRARDYEAIRCPVDSGSLTPEVQASVYQQTDDTVPAQGAVTWITYMDDEGGIVGKLDLNASAGRQPSPQDPCPL
jgi:hypothetical protein